MNIKWDDLCKKLAVVILVLGAIGSIFIAIEDGVNIEAFASIKPFVQRDWALTIAIIIGGFFSTFLVSVLFYCVGEALEYLMVIHSNMEALMQEEEDVEDESQFWVCAKCGKKNKDYTGTCSCGAEKK